MKTSKLYMTLALMAVILFLTPFRFTYLNSQEVGEYPDFDWSLIYPDGFDDLEVYEGGDIGEAQIICSYSQKSGRCYQFINAERIFTPHEWSGDDKESTLENEEQRIGKFFMLGTIVWCEYTGITSDKCTKLQVILEFLISLEE